jgi:hypothetical protein
MPVPAPSPETDSARGQREQLESKVASLERELAKTQRLAEKVKEVASDFSSVHMTGPVAAVYSGLLPAWL